MSQVKVINKCLNIFCASSGQKISHEKTKIYFLRMLVMSELMR